MTNKTPRPLSYFKSPSELILQNLNRVRRTGNVYDNNHKFFTYLYSLSSSPHTDSYRYEIMGQVEKKELGSQFQ
jgi:hypothetical protein